MTGDTLLLNADGLPTVLPLSTMIWQDAVKAIWLDTVSVIEYYDDWVVHSPTMEMRVPSIVMNRRYINVQRSAQYNRDNILLRDRYTCAYCNERFPEHKLTLDHVHPQTFGGKSTWTNIVTACSPCNNKRGCDFSIRPNYPAYRPSYHDLVAKRREFPIIVPEEAWVQYLSWPEENVVVRQRKRKNNVIRLAA